MKKILRPDCFCQTLRTPKQMRKMHELPFLEVIQR